MRIKDGEPKPLISNAVILILIGAAVLSALTLIFGYKALHWPAISTTGLTLPAVAGTLTAFFAIALTIERAGQVCIKLIQKDAREETQTRLDTLKLQIQTQNAESQALTRAAPASIGAQPNDVAAHSERVRRVNNSLSGAIQDVKDEEENLAKIEREASTISVKVALPLAILIAVSGVHFLESLFGPQTPSTFVMDETRFNALVDAVKPASDAAAADVLSAAKSSLKADFKEAAKEAQLHLTTFRFVDIIITSLLLAGGSAGIRVLLDNMKKIMK